MHMHLPVLIHLATVVFHLVSVLLHLLRAISLSYMLFHCPCAISMEQQFSPYIFEWAIYVLYYYIDNRMLLKLCLILIFFF